MHLEIALLPIYVVLLILIICTACAIIQPISRGQRHGEEEEEDVEIRDATLPSERRAYILRALLQREADLPQSVLNDSGDRHKPVVRSFEGIEMHDLEDPPMEPVEAHPDVLKAEYNIQTDNSVHFRNQRSVGGKYRNKHISCFR